ncbi:MAG: hypothetical protein H0T46_33465 [Deltaproteobacteria bacterium]|nr:hypothetical protein [Deltaproteobacteria bacterium]
MTESKKWLVMGFNSYGRENYVVGAYATEAEAKQVMAEKQKEANADHMWIAEET